MMKLQLLVLSASLAVVLTFPSGAPDSGRSDQCDAMTPGHNAVPQTGSLPFIVKCQESTNGRIKVVISSQTENKGQGGFKGLLVQIRDSANNRIGTINKAGSIYQSVCNNQAITHMGNNIKGRARMIFDIPEADRAKDLKCFITIVENFGTYWVREQFDVQRKGNN